MVAKVFSEKFEKVSMWSGFGVRAFSSRAAPKRNFVQNWGERTQESLRSVIPRPKNVFNKIDKKVNLPNFKIGNPGEFARQMFDLGRTNVGIEV